MMKRPVHISAQDLLRQANANKKDFAPLVLVSGQAHRVKLCVEYLDDAKKVFSFMGYAFFSGTYKGAPITVGNAGLYSPDTALMTELLCALGVDCLIRLGSCGALQEDIAIGDIVVADSALRGEGVTRYYVEDDYNAMATEEITECVMKSFSSKENIYRGKVWTTDAFLKETPEVINPVIKQGAIAVDMVTSAFFTVASCYKRKCASLLVASDNLITGEMGFGKDEFLIGQKRMIETALEVAKNIHL